MTDSQIIAKLKAEFTDQSSPLHSSYSPLIVAAQDDALAQLLNDPAGVGKGPVQYSTIGHEEFFWATLAIVVRCAHGADTAGNTLSAATVAKWKMIIEHLRTLEPLAELQLDKLQGLAAEAISDKVLLDAEAAAINIRTGSRAEVLCGATVVVTPLQVSQAR
jgi:hypothetical protein